MPTVRTLHDKWSFYHSPSCHMYADLRRGTVFDGDLGAYLLRTAADAVVEVDASPPVAVEPPQAPPVAPPASSPVVTTVVDDGPPTAPPAPPERVSVGDYDPGEFSAAVVLAYARDHADEVPVILKAERAGKFRTTLVGDLQKLLP